MKFSAFYLLSGGMFTAGALKVSEKPEIGLLFVGAVVVAVIGAMFEACNR